MGDALSGYASLTRPTKEVKSEKEDGWIPADYWRG